MFKENFRSPHCYAHCKRLINEGFPSHMIVFLIFYECECRVAINDIRVGLIGDRLYVPLQPAKLGIEKMVNVQ